MEIQVKLATMIIAAFMVQTIKVIRIEAMHEDSNTHVNIVRLVNHGENNMNFSIPACNVYEFKIYMAKVVIMWR